MARHDVLFTIPPRKLGKADATFRVKSDGQVMGTLTVSNGSIVWFPRGRTYGLKMGWARFDEMMREHARREEKR
jgi:hypothetical protein